MPKRKISRVPLYLGLFMLCLLTRSTLKERVLACPEPTTITPSVEYVQETVYIPVMLESEIVDTEPQTNPEAELIAIVTMAEAEGESELGKRLVIDSILNRVDREPFPDTINDVIYQPNQYSCMWNGRFDRCYLKDDIYQLVLEETECRTNNDVVFFRTQHYSDYGVPMFQEGSHYFSSYD